MPDARSRAWILAVALALVLALPPSVAIGSPAATPGVTSAPWVAWRTQTAISRVYNAPGFALDANGLPHTIGSKLGVLHHAWSDGVSWNDEVVPTPERAFGYTSLAYHRTGGLHAAVTTDPFDTDGGELYYASRATNGSWSLLLVDSTTINSDVGLVVRLFFDSSDQPHMTYGGWGAGQYESHAYRDNSGWHVERVDAGGGLEQAAFADALGGIHACYSIIGDNPQKGNQVYAHRSPAGVWTTQVMDHDQSGPCGIAMDSLGRIHMSYTGGTLRYAVLDHGAWTIQLLPLNAGWHTDLAINSRDEVQIAANEPNNPGFANDPTIGHLYYFTKDATGAWQKDLVDPQTAGFDVLIRLDSHDRPHLAYVHLVDDVVDALDPVSSLVVAEPFVADALRPSGL